MSTELEINTKFKSLNNLMLANKKQIEMALPKHITADRIMRIALTECRKNPALLECTRESFMGAIIQTAQLGLEPGSALGHAYLVPFKKKKEGITEVQLIIGYRGMMNLAYRSESVSHVIARAVYEGDKFTFRYGFDEALDHHPDPDAMGNKLTHAYAIVFLKGGGKIFEVMELKEINAARARSKSADDGPWVTDYEAMAKKSVVRKLFKYMPVSIELQNAIGIDEAGDRGEQNNGLVFETEGGTVPDGDPRQPVTNGAANAAAMLGGNNAAAEPKPDPIPAAKKTAPVAAAKKKEDIGLFNKTYDPKKPPQKSFEQLEKEIGDLVAHMKMIEKDLIEMCETELKKHPKDMNTADDLEKVLAALEQRARG